MPGGVARDGWYPIGIGKKKLLKNGTPGVAIIQSHAWMSEASSIGNAQHDFRLIITVPGKEPYELQGLFRIPVRLMDKITNGITVPVRVHPTKPKHAVIDWDQWGPASGPGG